EFLPHMKEFFPQMREFLPPIRAHVLKGRDVYCGRLIFLHAGTSGVFVPNSCLLFASKQTTDFHEEMNHDTFSKWFRESLVPNLSAPSVIVMDNAPYPIKKRKFRHGFASITYNLQKILQKPSC
ncbi:hypothetical protein J6590_105942, partial [Homalodisca vitripennis]